MKNLFVLSFCLAQPLAAATLSFTSTDDYDRNFRETVGGAGITAASGILSKTGDNSALAIYNTTATGGTGGSGGTGVGTAANNLFTNFRIRMDLSTPTYAGGYGVGFAAKVVGNSGYIAIFRIMSATTADFRLFESNSNISTGALGTMIDSKTVTGSFSLNTFYTFSLEVTDAGSDVRFAGSVLQTNGTLIANYDPIVDTTSAVTGAGEVGIRLGSNANGVSADNFSVEAIPEPSGAALLVLGGVATALRRRR